MKISIDGIETEVTYGETILEAASKAGINIPTLCYNEAFGGQGACRFCMVEIQVGERKRLVASCTYPITEEMEVRTTTPAIREVRRNIITLLYRRAPNSDLMKKLFQEYNCPRFEPLDPQESCIMCLLCVKACEKVGANAISSVLRGTEKKVATPFDQGSDDCVGCSACADICPTGAIAVKEVDGKREIWHRSFAMSRCEVCGEYYSTKPVNEYVKGQTELHSSCGDICPNCRRKKIATQMAKVCLDGD